MDLGRSPAAVLGASLSVRAARQYDLDVTEIMGWGVRTLSLNRLRLMSYWDEHEAKPGVFDFSALRQQLDLAQELGVEVTMCLGLRQPRWPETHRPEWARDLNGIDLEQAVLKFIDKTLEVAEEYDCITSYQLENEALNKGIGHNHDFSRRRLRSEMRLTQSRTTKPVIMSLSNSWGLPVLGPIPDIWAVSIYPYQWTERGKSVSPLKPWMIRFRVNLIKLLWRRDVFCHELQMEPWGPGGTDTLPLEQQMELMNIKLLRRHLDFARACRMNPIDLWGLEWWYSIAKADDAFAEQLTALLSPRSNA